MASAGLFQLDYKICIIENNYLGGSQKILC
jgi:hypothetical protein